MIFYRRLLPDTGLLWNQIHNVFIFILPRHKRNCNISLCPAMFDLSKPIDPEELKSINGFLSHVSCNSQLSDGLLRRDGGDPPHKEKGIDHSHTHNYTYMPTHVSHRFMVLFCGVICGIY